MKAIIIKNPSVVTLKHIQKANQRGFGLNS
jgi:hypothetical protein